MKIPPSIFAGLLAVAALLALGGCHTTTVATAQADGIELLIQQGHAQPPSYINAWSDAHHLHLLTLEGGEARAWRAPIDNPEQWSVRRLWQAREHTWWLGHESREYVLMMTTQSTELYRPGDWSKALLTRADGLFARTKALWNIMPAEHDAAWRGFAIQESGDADGDGHAEHFRLFFSPDGQHWGPLVLDAMPQSFADFVRIEPGRFAVQLAQSDASPAVWLAFELGADLQWTRCAKFPGRYGSVAVFDRPLGLVLAPETTPGQPTPASRWYYREAPGVWSDLASLLPGVPAISAVEVRSPDRVWAVVGPSGPLDLHFYARSALGAWTPLAKLLDEPTATIRDATTIAAGKGIAIQAGLHDLPAQHASNWRYYLFAQSGRLVPLHSLLPDAPQKIWKVRSEGEGRLLGIQELGGADDAEQAYTTRWYIHVSSGWARLDDITGVASSAIADVRADTAAVFKLELHAHATADANEQWWIDLGQGFVALADALGDDFKVPKRLQSVTREPAAAPAPEAANIRGAGYIKLTVDKQHILWFVEGRNRRWHPLQDVIVARRDASLAGRAAHVFPGIWSVSAESDALISVMENWDTNANGVVNEFAHLVRGKDDLWQPADVALAQSGAGPHVLSEVSEVSDAMIASQLPGQPRAFFRRLADGQWVAADHGLAQDAGTIVDAYTFLSARGVALRRKLPDAAIATWHYYYHDEARGWITLAQALPGGFAHIASVYSLAGDQLLALQEQGDSDGDGLRNQWAYFVRDREGAFLPLATAIADAPRRIWQLASFLQGHGLAIQEERTVGDNQIEHRWHFYARAADGAWRPLNALLPELADGAAIDKVHSFFGQNGLAVRLGHDGGWRLFERASKSSAWMPLELNTPIARLLAIQGDVHANLLAIRTPTDDGEGIWTSFVRSDKGRWQPANARHGALSANAQDLRIFDAASLLGVQARATGQDGAWQWFSLSASGIDKHLGHTSGPDWPGFSYTQAPTGQLVIAEATHVIDGVEASSAPAPKAWFHRSDVATAGHVYRAPEAIAQGVDVYAPGTGGLLLVYEVDGRRRATFFSRGSVEVRTHEVAAGVGLVEKVRFIYNTLPDGTTRVHRFDDPTLFIMLHSDSSGAQIYYDDRGYFYDARAGHSLEALSFRRGNEVYTFRQLAAYLFRPDRLEERLGLLSGSFFTLTESDQARIASARELAGQDELALASLRPPQLDIVGRVDERVTTSRVDIRVSATGRGLDEHSFEAHILGAGQSRSVGATARTQAPDAPMTTIAKTLTVALLEGDNHIELSVVDAAGLTHTRTARVRYEPAEPEPRTLWLGIVAASDYDDARLQPLRFTANDAQSVLAAFNAQQGKLFDRVKVRQWCDAPTCDARAHHGVLRREVPEFFSTMGQGDYATFFVSGHGTKIGHTYHFVPTDADLDREESLISWPVLESWLSSSPVLGKRLLILDSCHSGALARDGREKERIVEQAYRNRGLYILSASAADAYAYELQSLGNGLLTHALKRGLAGSADTSPADGRVTFQELSYFVAREVRELAARHRMIQEPYAPIVDAAMNFALAQVTRTRFSIALTVITVNANDDIDHNVPAQLEHWQNLLTSHIHGLRVVKDHPTLLVEFHLRAGAIRLVIKAPDGKRHIVEPLDLSSEGPEALSLQIEQALENAALNL
ncbi:MAG: caspase family protein [Bradymonadaceae bacterium]|nr:caspase family protein [Lujinxingiaceae bacterium]